MEDEMRREMRHHLEMEIAEQVRRGMSEDEARRTALLAFGGVTNAEESVRDERRTRVIENLLSDIRYALRGFARQPGYAVVVVVLLALGIGGNTALFSVVYHELIAPLPFADGDRMVELDQTGGQGTFRLGVDLSMAETWQRTSRTVEQVTIAGSGRFIIGDTTSADPKVVVGSVIVPGVSRFLGLRPELGRDITDADTVSGAVPVALISDSLWRADYRAERSVLGSAILIDGVRHVIIGVVPADYQIPFVLGNDMLIARRPLPANPTRVDLRLNGTADAVAALAKLRPGVSVERANREVKMIFAQWSRSPEGVRFAGKVMEGVSIDTPHIMRAVDEVEPKLRQMVLVLFAAMSLVLLIACANIANLLLVRAWSRQRELAVRAAMGASTSRLVGQMFTESVLLAAAGAAAGVGVATLTLRAISRSPLGEQVTPGGLNLAVLGWCIGLSFITALLFGSAPARFAAEGRMTDALKAGARSASASRASRRVRASLVGLEIALSVMLLAGAGLFVRSLIAMERADVGLDTRGLVSLRMYFPPSKVSAQARAAAVSAMQARIAAIPGVQSVSVASMAAPEFGIFIGGFQLADRPLNPADSVRMLGFVDVEPAYFARLGLHLTAGRVFSPDSRITDSLNSAEVVINERFARRFWAGGDAVGKRIKYGSMAWSTIVGVVHDVTIPGRDDHISSLQVYMPIPAAPFQAAFVVRSAIQPSRLQALFRAAAHDASASIRVESPIVADDFFSTGRVVQRTMLELLGVFAAVALLLAAIGLHAVVAFSVSQRTREIGMRMALGAQTADVVRLVVGQGVGIAVVGVALGGAAALAATRVLRSYLYGVQPADPTTFVVVVAGLVVVAVLASVLPARRAARLDPVDALRAE